MKNVVNILKMIKVVLDTNILVSALWKRPGNASSIVDLIALGHITPCHNAQIISEYKNVLLRTKFRFAPSDIANLLDLITKDGLSVLSKLSSIPFADESDRVFYDVAVTCGAYLVTGNGKHYPNEPFILTPAQFLSQI